ncbi:MAG: hypothetical protein ACOCZA_10915 [Spirochaetota bacterium]
MFALLGRDDAGGGIVWHPDVLPEGRKHGLYLLKDKRLADTTAGDPVPSEEELFPTMTAEEVAGLDTYTVAEMMQFINKKSELQATRKPFGAKGEFVQYNLSGYGAASSDFLIKSRDDACIFAYRMDSGVLRQHHLQSCLPQADLHFPGECGHILTLEKPESLAELLGLWLRKNILF